MPEAVDAEAPDSPRFVRGVEIAGVEEVLTSSWRSLGDDVENRLRLGLADGLLPGHRQELAVDPDERRRADLQMEVASAALDDVREQVAKIDCHRLFRYRMVRPAPLAQCR